MADTLPHRRKYILLAQGLGRRLLEAHVEWLEEVERELATDAEGDLPVAAT